MKNIEWSEQKIALPPGACANCGGEGQEQWINDAGEPAARTCPECRGTGNAKNPTNHEIGNALAACNEWIAIGGSIGEYGVVIRDALREVLATRSWIDGARMIDAEAMYQRILAIIDEEAGSMSVREEQCRGAMVALGHLLGHRKLNDIERAHWLPQMKP